MSRARVLSGVAVAIVVIVGIVLGVVLANSSSKTPAAAPTRPSRLNHIQYVRLFESTVIGKTRISSLSSWPAPYQAYHDQYGHACYEWWDKPNDLFNLCFTTKGVLWAKVVE